MDYEEFLQTIKKEMTTDFSVYHAGEYDGLKIGIQDVEKLQDSYRGLTIGREGESIQICLDLREHYKMYQNGVPLDRIIYETEQSTIKGLDGRGNLNLIDFTNYDLVKPRLTMQVIGKEGKEELLKDIPHKDMGDLATVYRIELDHTDDATATVMITNQLMERLGINAEQLHQDAMEMAQKTHPAELVPMGQLLQNMMGMEKLPMDVPQIYVATNSQKLMGASVMNYPSFMEESAGKLGGDFFIIPSSVHELLFLPAKDGHDVEQLKSMVKEVNDTQVSPKDRLSYQVYYYSKDEKTIELAEKAVQKKLKRKRLPRKTNLCLQNWKERNRRWQRTFPLPEAQSVRR